jgi:hypothetical protein
MDEVWRTVHLFVPSSLTGSEVTEYLHAQIRSIAHDAGELIHQSRIGAGIDHSTGWHRWSVSYLPGPRGIFHH